MYVCIYIYIYIYTCIYIYIERERERDHVYCFMRCLYSVKEHRNCKTVAAFEEHSR